MSLTSSCIAVCAPLTAIASVLLFMMAHMLGSGNWTFEVLAAKHQWDVKEKAAVCRRAAVLYLCASLSLWVAQLAQTPLYRLWMLLPWNRRLRDAEERRTRVGLLLAVDEVDGGGHEAGQRRGGGRSHRSRGQPPEEATELSALDWGHEGMGPSTSIKAPLSAPAAAAAATAPGSRRFPDFLRSLGDAARPSSPNSTGGRGGAEKNFDSASSSPRGEGGVSLAAGGVGAAWGRARGLRSRAGPSATSDAPAAVTIYADPTPLEPSAGVTGSTVLAVPSLHASLSPAAHGGSHRQPLPMNGDAVSRGLSSASHHANLWNGAATEPSSVDDSDFMSDVELDTTRHHGLRQLRASGWGLQQQQQQSQQQSHAPTRRQRGRGGDGGAGLHATARSVGSDAGAAGGPLHPEGEAASMITTLWPSAAAGPASTASQSRQLRASPAGGPPPAMPSQKNKHI